MKAVLSGKPLMTTSPLKSQIQDQMKAAMKAHDKERLATIRLILAALKQKEVDERVELDDAQVIEILGKMVKQRRDSISQFQAANREDLAEKEQVELDLINEFLPPALDEAELDAIIEKAISDTGASSMKEMGAAMAQIKAAVAGRADMGAVSKKLKARLA